MAFFEQIGKKITDMGQGVAQQTKNLTDVARLNATISEKERLVGQIFAALGHAYYERHKDDPNAEEPQMIKDLNNLRQEIAQAQEEIKQKKGVVSCPNCGAELSPNAAFCTRCGTRAPQPQQPVESPAAPNARVCPNCQAPVGEGNLFCTRCGTRL